MRTRRPVKNKCIYISAIVPSYISELSSMAPISVDLPSYHPPLELDYSAMTQPPPPITPLSLYLPTPKLTPPCGMAIATQPPPPLLKRRRIGYRIRGSSWRRRRTISHLVWRRPRSKVPSPLSPPSYFPGPFSGRTPARKAKPSPALAAFSLSLFWYLCPSHLPYSFPSPPDIFPLANPIFGTLLPHLSSSP